MTAIETALREVGYEPRPAEELAVKAMLQQKHHSGLRAALLEGPPGCGKTFLAECVARALGARYVYHLLHSWSDDQELFYGIDVAAAVEGAAERVRQPGVLAVAAEASTTGLVVLCLDEIDKVQERTEYLLLDFLQSGRVPVRPGLHLEVKKENLLVFVTSNGERPLSDALLRRVRRVRMHPLPAENVERIMSQRANVPIGICRLIRKVAQEVAGADEAQISVQELCLLAADIWRLAHGPADVREYLAQWAARGDAGHAAALKADIAPLWGEVMAQRRAAK